MIDQYNISGNIFFILHLWIDTFFYTTNLYPHPSTKLRSPMLFIRCFCIAEIIRYIVFINRQFHDALAHEVFFFLLPVVVKFDRWLFQFHFISCFLFFLDSRFKFFCKVDNNLSTFQLIFKTILIGKFFTKIANEK